MNAQIVYTPLTEIVYARSFFITSPGERPLMPGEMRIFPAKYAIGAHEKATAFRLDWYENQADADARQDLLTDSSRLPTAVFTPEVPNPNGRPTQLLDVSVALTAPMALNLYTRPIAVLEMVQTTQTIPPYLYLLSDAIQITDRVTDYRFRYKVGTPASTAFELMWYATRLDSLLRIDELTDTARLPTARFIPKVPDADAPPDVYQDGVLRLTPSTHETPYTEAVGLLCMVQQPAIKGDPKTNPVGPIEPPRRHHKPTWEIK